MQPRDTPELERQYWEDVKAADDMCRRMGELIGDYLFKNFAFTGVSDAELEATDQYVDAALDGMKERCGLPDCDVFETKRRMLKYCAARLEYLCASAGGNA